MSYPTYRDDIESAKERLRSAHDALLLALPILVGDAAELIESDSMLDIDGAPIPGTARLVCNLIPTRLAAIRSAEACVGKVWRQRHEQDREWIFEAIDGERAL